MYKEVVRGGFGFSHDRFWTIPGNIERDTPEALRRMFLPGLTREANRVLRDKYYFVKGQFQHYGVEYDESEFHGNGTNLLKKMLCAGKVSIVLELLHKRALRIN